MWQPDAEPLRKLRRELDRRSTRIKQVLTDERIRKAFLGGAPNNEKKVVKAFIGLDYNASNALKRNPKVSLKIQTPDIRTERSPVILLYSMDAIIPQPMLVIDGSLKSTRLVYYNARWQPDPHFQAFEVMVHADDERLRQRWETMVKLGNCPIHGSDCYWLFQLMPNATGCSVAARQLASCACSPMLSSAQRQRNYRRVLQKEADIQRHSHDFICGSCTLLGWNKSDLLTSPTRISPSIIKISIFFD